MTAIPHVEAFYDESTSTLTYVVFDGATKDAVVIDPVLDYDSLASQTSTSSIERVVDFVVRNGLRLRASLETHAHADHLSAGPWLHQRFDVPVAIGAGITEVQTTFKRVFSLDDAAVDGSQFDLLLEPGTKTTFGSLEVRSLSTPGHTPACLSYLIGDAVFTGDALFIEDYGTGRTDFPAGNAGALYHSVHEVLYSLPDSTRVFPGHDYKPGGRELRFQTTIAVEKASNVQLRQETGQHEFIAFRNNRDASLRPPRLLYQSVQVNVFGGRLPAPDSSGARFLKIPLNRNRPTDEAGSPLHQSPSPAAPK